MRPILTLCTVLGLAVAAPAAAAEAPLALPSHQPVTVHPAQALSASPMAQLQTLYTRQELDNGVYVGSEFCIACHPGQGTWRNTKHAQALRRPMTRFSLMPGKGVVADFDNNGVDDFRQGLDFNQIASAFDPFKPNAPVLSVEGGRYFITIGQLKMPIVATQGGTGDWKQRYLVRVPVAGTPDGFSRENYVSPVQYNEVPRQYVVYHPEAWYDGNNQPRFGPGTPVQVVAAENNRTYSKKCIGCHTTGTRELGQTAQGEYFYRAFTAVLFRANDPGYFDYDHDGVVDLVNIGCESCHGPGSAHILGGGDPSKIVNPAKLDTPAANAVCGQCHTRVKSVPDGLHDWPYQETTKTPFTPGRTDIEDFFTDASGRWPDGINSRQHHQQWLDFIKSPKPGFQFHPVQCVECHDPHGRTTNPHLIRDQLVERGVPIPTQADNNTLCLACHAGFGPFRDLGKQTIADIDQEANRNAVAKVVSAHTNHPYAPERRMGLSRCTECHMPKIAKSAIDYDIRSHVFEAIPPEKTLTFQDQGGMPNSCAVSCHSLKANLFDLGIDPTFNQWNEPFDRLNARMLEIYFGPGGLWWDTSDGSSVTNANLKLSAQPGEVPPPTEDD